MTQNSIELDEMIGSLAQLAKTLPDKRNQANNNLTYSMEDALLSAFAVFFMQSPSFLAHQRDMKRNKGKSNVGSLFGVEQIPSDQQIRNILSPLTPQLLSPIFDELHQMLEKAGVMKRFVGYGETQLVSLDGFTFYTSTQICCDQCNQRRDRNGTVHYYHAVIEPVIVHPKERCVLPLPPEFIVPQDGEEKEDCERNALKRWLEKQSEGVKPWTRTYLGDALQSNQPLCALIAAIYRQYFLFGCKPDNHKILYEWLDGMERGGTIESIEVTRWREGKREIWTIRFASDVPLRGGDDALFVNWLSLTVTDGKTGDQLYTNSWVTNHVLNHNCVVNVAETARAYWKIENASHNILTTKGYHIKHNFGHQNGLGNLLFTLNVLAFFMHTILDLTHPLYKKLRLELGRRDVFFNDMEALTRYLLFTSWQQLWLFMATGLQLEQ